MRFDFEQLFDDYGGEVIVTAETGPEILEVIRHFRLIDDDTQEGITSLAATLAKGPPFSHRCTHKRRGDELTAWYAVETALDYDFTAPYAEMLQRRTGYADNLPDLDLTPVHPRRLCHTHFTDWMRLEQGHICFLAYDSGHDWNGKTAQQYVWDMAADYVAEDVGDRRHEPEYITTDRGRTLRNPNYLKRHRAHPAVKANWLWMALFNWWRQNRASDGQRRILEAVDAWDKRVGFRHCSHRINNHDTGYYYNDPDGKDGTGYVSLEAFRAL